MRRNVKEKAGEGKGVTWRGGGRLKEGKIKQFRKLLEGEDQRRRARVLAGSDSILIGACC